MVLTKLRPYLQCLLRGAPDATTPGGMRRMWDVVEPGAGPCRSRCADDQTENRGSWALSAYGRNSDRSSVEMVKTDRCGGRTARRGAGETAGRLYDRRVLASRSTVNRAPDEGARVCLESTTRSDPTSSPTSPAVVLRRLQRVDARPQHLFSQTPTALSEVWRYAQCPRGSRG